VGGWVVAWVCVYVQLATAIYENFPMDKLLRRCARSAMRYLNTGAAWNRLLGKLVV